MIWTIISWVVVGLIGGAIAKAIMPGNQGGDWIMTMILGIVGAFVGGFLGNGLIHGDWSFGRPDFSIGGLITSIVGALIVLFVWGWLQGRNTTSTNANPRV